MENYIRKPNYACDVCQKMIYIRPYNLRNSKSGKAFCSNACYGKFCQRPVACSVCGVEFLASKNAKTCSRSCANKSRIGKNYNRGGGAPKKDKVKDFKAIRNRLFEIKKAKCERCEYNIVPEVLHAHHIIERCNGGSDDISNLELLCPTCHEVEHYNRRQANKK